MVHLFDRPSHLARLARTGLPLALLLVLSPPLWAQRAEPAGRPDEPASRPGKDNPPPAKAGGLRMSRAVVCRTIDGYESYQPLPGAKQTSEEKLLVYFRPMRYKVEPVDNMFQARLTEDAEIRKRGDKKILRQKLKVLDYTAKSKDPPRQIFLRNTISLKGLPPGEYDLTIILHDELDKGSPPSRQVVRFTIVPPEDPRKKSAARQGNPPPQP
jgi:hypothetical protein